MPVEHVFGPGDPRVSDYRTVAEPELVRSRGLFVAEGRLIVRRLLETRRSAIRSILLSEAAYRSLEDALTSVSDQVPIYLCRSADFLGVTGHNIHRGCLALVERPPVLALTEVLADARTIVVLEDVSNADNVGGVFRNAAAFGIDAVLLNPTSCDPLYRKAIRTSMAATLRVPFARVSEWPDGLRSLRARGFTIAALTPHPTAVALDAFVEAPRPNPVALLVGGEGAGISDGAEALAHVRVRIPIAPEIDSLNLAVAVGIALFQVQGSRVQRSRFGDPEP